MRMVRESFLEEVTLCRAVKVEKDEDMLQKSLGRQFQAEETAKCKGPELAKSHGDLEKTT